MLQIDKITPMASEEIIAQFRFQLFDPLIIIKDLAGSQVQIYFPVYDLTENNLVLSYDAPLISPLY